MRTEFKRNLIAVVLTFSSFFIAFFVNSEVLNAQACTDPGPSSGSGYSWTFQNTDWSFGEISSQSCWWNGGTCSSATVNTWGEYGEYTPEDAGGPYVLRNIYKCTYTPPPANVIASLNINPYNISPGQSATITWDSTNATSCTGTGFSTGGLPGSGIGVSTGPLYSNTTYSLTCAGANGSATDSKTVGVSSGSGPCPTLTSGPGYNWTQTNFGGQNAGANDPIQCTFSGQSTICNSTWVGSTGRLDDWRVGDVNTYSWADYRCDATSSTGSGSIGVSVACTNGSTPASGTSWTVSGPNTYPGSNNQTISNAPYGSYSIAYTSIPSGGYSFSSYSSTDGGSSLNINSSSPNKSFTINLICPNPTPPSQPTISANPNPVAYSATTQLSWSVTNTPATCSASGGWSGNVSCNASGNTFTTGILNSDTTFTIIASNSGGQGTDSVVVHVKPATPTLSATPLSCGTNQISLSWNSTALATSYQLYRNGTQIYSGSGTSFTDTSLSPGVTYNYTVAASNSWGQSPQSSTISAAAPSACTGSVSLTANNQTGSITISSGQSATLRWTSNNVTSCTGTNFSTGGATNNSTGVSTGALSATQTYSISCNVSGGGTTGSSVTVNVSGTPPSTPLTAPTVTTSSTCGGYIQVSWSSVTGSSGYKLYRDGSGTGIDVGNSLSYTDGAFSLGSSHSYRVSAYNSSGESGQSPSASGSSSGACSPTPVVSISASPTSGQVNVVNPQLTWSATNSPTSCTASGDWSGAKAVSGTNVSQGTLTQVRTYTYTLTCSNASGAGAPNSTTVTVTSSNATINVVESGASGGSWVISPGSYTGTSNSVSAGTYTLTSTGLPPGYSVSSITSTDGGNSLNVSTGQTKQFTINYISNSAATAMLYANGTPVELSLSSTPPWITLTWNSTNANRCYGIGFPVGATSNMNPGYNDQPVTWNTKRYSLYCTPISGSTPAFSSVLVRLFGNNEPTTLTATATSNPCSQGPVINLSWSVLGGSPDSYEVYRSSANSDTGQYFRIATNLTGLSYQDTGSAGSTYYYIIVGLKSGFPGSTSNKASATAPTCTPSFDYSLSASSPTSVYPGGTTQSTVAKTLTSGSTQTVFLNVTGLPSGITASYDANRDCSPSCSTTTTFNVGSSVSPGSYPVTMQGTATGGPTRTSPITITVNTPVVLTVNVTTSASSPNPVGDPVVWNASLSAGTGCNYTWSGTDVPTSPAPTGTSYTINYQSTGTKNIRVDVLCNEGSASGTNSINVFVDPNFKQF